MPAFRLNVSARHKGALFSAGATQAAGRRLVTGMNDLLAQEGVRRVKARLRQVLQNPTGYYESRIQVDRRGDYRGISDGGVVYGGWLEGVDSRNKTTRFKGYRTFRIVRQDMNKDKERIVSPLMAQYIREMNR